jgi:eukaryotic-like serine/threonine-protein kinase
VDQRHWSRVEACYHAALERPAHERAAFLENYCVGEPEVRHEVESLLAHEGHADELLESPAWNHVTPHTLTEGAVLADYRVTGKVGSGGMGQVYRASDTKLQREVALKVLASDFAHDSAWLSRFRREARVLASLNHPHIAAIYGLEESDGVLAIAMELVEGPTLAERMARGRIPVPEALELGKQIAEALEFAHEKGIVHRDLKPANVKIRVDGMVKVLDFGLAKAADRSENPSLTATGAGVIVGTPAYMAPEQAAGLPVDRRADIWSFGVVLFEMLAGRQIYARETTLETLVAVSRDDPNWHELPSETAATVRTLLRRCLDRDAKNRLRDIGEARICLSDPGSVTNPDGAGFRLPRKLPWAVAVLAILCCGAFLHFHEGPVASVAAVRFQIPLPEISQLGSFSLAPDGRKVAFNTGDRLWVHSLESGESRALTSSTSLDLFWSPDSRFIGYKSGGKLKRIEAAGGTPQTVADLPGGWGSGDWNRDNVIVFANLRVGLFRVAAAGGLPVQITALDPARQERWHAGPSFLPDGVHFVYTRASNDPAKSAVYVGSLDAKPEQQSSKPLVASIWQAAYAPSADSGVGYLLFVREGTLMAQPFDNRRLELKGQATPIADRLADNNGGTGGHAAFSVSVTNVLAFRQSPALDLQLTWSDRSGRILGTAGEPGDYRDLALSPDGTRLAFAKLTGQVSNIWLLDLSRNISTRFTFGSAHDTHPVWSPDGRRIVFASDRDGPFDNLYEKSADGLRDVVALLKSSHIKIPTSWSRDGRFLLFGEFSAKMRGEAWVFLTEGEKKPVPFPVAESDVRNAYLSPDGRWVAYLSYDSTPSEVCVRSFSINSAGTVAEAGGMWQVSNGGGKEPHWSGDSRELYYESLSDRRLMAVEMTASSAFSPGKPQPIGIASLWPGRGAWVPSADGKRFLVLKPKSGPEPYTVVLNWQASLKK